MTPKHLTFPGVLISTLLTAAIAHADDGVSADAPDMVSYTGIGEDCCGEDPHPVHGAPTPDGGVVICGKSIDEDGEWEGFVVKVGPDIPEGTVFYEPDEGPTYAWSVTFGSDGRQDGANNVVATDEAVFVAGFVTEDDGTLDRNLRKYNLFSGALIWEISYPDTTSRREGALESIHLLENGDAIVGGFINGSRGSAEGFKSYGNPTSGEATIQYFTAAQLAAGTPPSAPLWSQTYGALISVKSVRPLAEGGFVLVASNEDEEAQIMRVDADGEKMWSRSIRQHGEVTDVAVLEEGGASVGFMVSGHRGESGGIDGSVSRIDLDGEVVWKKSYGDFPGGVQEFAGLDGGNPALIFDECWGIQATAGGGAVVACGTGIEGCDEVEGDLYDECRSDPRQVWRGLVLEVDGDGDVLWSRLDSFRFPEEGEDEAADSASEYVILTEDGNVGSIVDQGFGIGLLMLGEVVLDEDPSGDDDDDDDDDDEWDDDGAVDEEDGGGGALDDEPATAAVGGGACQTSGTGPGGLGLYLSALAILGWCRRTQAL
jgi:hypothetical protein